MKLRVRGDSLRLRLTRSEVAALARDGLVEESIAFGPGRRLVYAIRSAPDGAPPVAATLDGTRIEVTLPAADVRRWAETDLVGIEGVQDAGEQRTLRVVVEKDFACLKPRPHEDDADAFPNPNVSS
jgi:hypothetical protein